MVSGLFYNILFRTAAAAVQTLAQDSRFVGGRMGLVGVLHTWGRNLSYHPHVHFLTTAGGVAADALAAHAPAWRQTGRGRSRCPP